MKSCPPVAQRDHCRQIKERGYRRSTCSRSSELPTVSLLKPPGSSLSLDCISFMGVPMQDPETMGHFWGSVGPVPCLSPH